MDSKTVLIIAYAGNLPFVEKQIPETGILKTIKELFWTYRHTAFNEPYYKSGDCFLKGLKKFIEKYPGKKVRVKFWGLIDPVHQQLVEKYRLTEHVEISGFIPKKESLEKLNQCDVLLLTLAGGKNGIPPVSLPGKLYDYFKTGKPVLACIQDSECAQILRESGLGIICNPDNPEEIAEKINFLFENRENLENIFRLHNAYVETRFSAINTTRQLASLFGELLLK